MKKIVILVGGLPPVYNGGTEIATANIAVCAAKMGYEMHVIALDGTNRGKDLYRIDGVEVHRVKTTKVKWLVMDYMPAIVLEIMKLKPDLVHAQSMPMGLSACVAHKLTGVPYLVYSRGEMYINWPLKRLLSRIIMRNANRVVAQTNDMKDGLLKIQDRDIEVIPNGIDLSKFQPMSKSEARTRLRLQPNMKMILFVGRARPEKNLFGFIDVMSCLRSRGDCYGIALGDGQQLEQAKRMADSRGLYNIMFKGNVDNSEVPIYMHAADTLVNTSHSEGFPVVFLEAMACGLPIVAPKICGIPEIIDNEKNGFLVDLGNPVEIALVVSRILNDDELVREIRRNNFKKAREFSWENVVKKLY